MSLEKEFQLAVRLSGVTEAAREMGVSRPTIYSWLSGLPSDLAKVRKIEGWTNETLKRYLKKGA